MSAPTVPDRSPQGPVGPWAQADVLARRYLTRLRHLLRTGFTWLRRQWRTSLQFRVVTVTLTLGTIVLTIVGSYLYQQVAGGLVEERRLNASAEVLQLTRKAQLQFDLTDKVQSSDALLEAATNTVQDVAGTEGTRFVILVRGENNTSKDVVLPPVRSGEVGLNAVPTELRQRVADTPGVQQTQIVSLKITGEEDVLPAWVIGQQMIIARAGHYGLYFIYPMTRERDTLALVGRTFFWGLLVLMLLIGGVAYVVTRLVVAPVRRAAAVAGRFASGALDERMKVRGEDDLASLASSFNGMAASLQQQIVQLENLSRFQQRFVSDVSHELRTPLTTIRMAGDLIHDSRADFDPAVSRSAELLHNELDRFEALLSDLLEISRFDAGAAVLDVEPTDVRITVGRVVGAAAPLAERKGSLVTIEQPDEPCEAEIDSRRVERILRNLLVNAIEHGEGRPIAIRIARNECAVAVSVRDHGLGLRPGEGAMVFNRFWRADPARARTTGGTGLGLAISLEDARLHNGWLQAWGTSGEGSCFRLTLPVEAGVDIESSPLPLNPLPAARAETTGAPTTGTVVGAGGSIAPVEALAASGAATVDPASAAVRPGRPT